MSKTLFPQLITRLSSQSSLSSQSKARSSLQANPRQTQAAVQDSQQAANELTTAVDDLLEGMRGRFAVVSEEMLAKSTCLPLFPSLSAGQQEDCEKPLVCP